jgi:hypothetical protein
MVEEEIATGREEEVILGKVGEKFDTPEKIRKLHAYRLQKLIANKISFSRLWEIPETLVAFIEHNPFLNTTDKDIDYHLKKLKEAVE